MAKTLTLTTFLVLAALGIMAQSPPQATQGPPNAQQVKPDLNLILEQLQKAVIATNGDLGKLRIEKWKTDGDQKAQLQKMADSLQRNITHAMPGLIADVQNSRGSMSSTFKLYHNLTIVYEYLTSLTDAAGVLGKREEYEPLANDAAALDSSRQNLSNYIEQAASALESRKRTPPPPPEEPVPPPVVGNGHNRVVVLPNGVRRIIVDDAPSGKPAKPVKKKAAHPSHKASPKASPSPSPKPQ
ncbi:MAG TPA: hypothetical protein VLT16_18625 [Candidatus Limnocylindrales bacterium]|nr:hypothetical protein [Candidatus Limnocylindrales bacterium]